MNDLPSEAHGGRIPLIVIRVAITPYEKWIVVTNVTTPLIRVWLQFTGYAPYEGQIVYLDENLIAQGIPYDPDVASATSSECGLLPPSGALEASPGPAPAEALAQNVAEPTPTPVDPAPTLAPSTEAEVEAEIESIRSAAKEGHEANVLRQLAWLGIQDGEVVALQTLGQTRKDPAYLALVRSFAEAVRLTSPTGLIAQTKWGKTEPIGYQGIYIVGNRLVGRMDEVVVPGAWAPMPEGIITKERIRARRFLYLDLDTQRTDEDGTRINLPISATGVELRATLARSVRVRADIIVALGAIAIDRPADVIATMMSGNGTQLWVALDLLPETPELHDMVKEVLALWSVFYDHPSSHVDTSVFDAKRIAPLGGTPKKKGVRAELHRRVTFSGATSPRRLTLDELKAMVMLYRERLSPEQAQKAGKLLGVRPATEARALNSTVSSAGAPSTALEKVIAGIKRCNQVDVRDVGEKLGLDRENPICPGCGRGGTSSVAFVGNVLNCKYETCSKAGQTNRGPCDLVLQMVFNTAELKGHSRPVMTWFQANFGITP